MSVRSAPLFAFALLACVSVGFLYIGHRDTDFLSFYAGARLAGSSGLYSVQSAHALEAVYEQHPAEVRAYIRPPFYAAALWPLGRLPYRMAAIAWQLLNVAALAGFVLLWAPRVPSHVLACTFFPLFVDLWVGQDVPILLFLVALSVSLLSRRRNFLAGLVMALCAAKFHLFLLLPLLILSKRMGRFAAGLAVGGLGLLAVSFAAAGPRWIFRYLALLKQNETHQATQSYMPNLIGLFHAVPFAGPCIALLSLAVAIGFCFAARRVDLPHAVALMLFCGVVVGLHSLMYDLGFLLPWLLLRDTLTASFRIAALLSLTCFVLSIPSLAWLGALAVFAILLLDLTSIIAADARRRRVRPFATFATP